MALIRLIDRRIWILRKSEGGVRGNLGGSGKSANLSLLLETVTCIDAIRGLHLRKYYTPGYVFDTFRHFLTLFDTSRHYFDSSRWFRGFFREGVLTLFDTFRHLLTLFDTFSHFVRTFTGNTSTFNLPGVLCQNVSKRVQGNIAPPCGVSKRVIGVSGIGLIPAAHLSSKI